MGVRMVHRKTIILTGCDKSWSQYTKPRKEFKNYAEKHGIGFNYRLYKDTDPKLCKLQHIIFYLEQDYDYVVWVDYDTRVLDNSVNIMDYFDRHFSVGVCQHAVQSQYLIKNLLNGYKTFNVENTGVMIFKNNGYSRKLVAEMIKLVKRYYHSFPLVDNAAFLHCIKKSWLLKALYKRHNDTLSITFSSDEIMLLPNNFNYVRGKNVSVIPDIPVVIEHYAGVKNREDYLK